jgi:ribosomal protein S18 acetylase RimI-like enzyme
MKPAIKRLEDREQIYELLRRERLYAAYAIGDLEPALFKECEWYASSRNGKFTSLCLSFKGLSPDRVFLMGSPEDLEPIMKDLRTTKAYFSCRPQHLSVVSHWYSPLKTQAMLRMVLKSERFHPVEGSVVRVSPSEVHLLQDLYRWYGNVAFAPYQLEQGVFYGVERDGKLVATAGTHLVSRTYGLAIVGNVFTHSGYRGNGYAKICTSAVVEELLSQSLDVVLNVEESNTVARQIYEALGFEIYCSFVESLGVRRSTLERQVAAAG